MNNETESIVVLVLIYLLSFLFLVGAVIVGLLTVQLREQVKRKHQADMAMLADWDSALKALYSPYEADIIVALDKMWALCSPVALNEIQPAIRLLLNHANRNISTKAQQLLEKQSLVFDQK